MRLTELWKPTAQKCHIVKTLPAKYFLENDSITHARMKLSFYRTFLSVQQCIFNLLYAWIWFTRLPNFTNWTVSRGRNTHDISVELISSLKSVTANKCQKSVNSNIHILQTTLNMRLLYFPRPFCDQISYLALSGEKIGLWLSCINDNNKQTYRRLHNKKAY